MNAGPVYFSNLTITETGNDGGFWLLVQQVIRVKKLVGLPPPHSNYLDVFLRFRRTFVEVITFGGSSAHEF